MTTSLLDAIRRGLADDAGDSDKAAAATACKSLLAVLDAKPGEPLRPLANPVAPSPLAAGLQMLLSPQSGLLDRLIERMQDELVQTADWERDPTDHGADTTEPGRPGFRIPFVPIASPEGR